MKTGIKTCVKGYGLLLLLMLLASCYKQPVSETSVSLIQKEDGQPFSIIDNKGMEVAKVDTYGIHSIVMAHDFSEGMALVCTGDLKYGYVNSRGEMQVKPIYDMAFDFSDGLALVGTSNAGGQIAWSVIDNLGEEIFHLPLTDSRISEGFTCGRLVYRNMKFGYCGAINQDGKIVYRLPEVIEDVLPYRYDAAICCTADGVGLIDRSGKILIRPGYRSGKIIKKNTVAFQQKDKWALFDFRGKPLTEYIYDEVPESDQQRPQVLLRYRQKDGAIDEITPSVIPHQKPAVVTPEPAAITHMNQLRTVSKNSPFYQEARRIVSAGLPEDDVHNRQLILEYVESFRTAYTTRNIGFLHQVFSEEALIIVGRVVKESQRHPLNVLSSEQVVYNIRSKKEYLTRLEAVFATNGKIDVRFEDFSIMKHPTQQGIYGVSLKQEYRSELYSDEGYLFLLWDFREPSAPAIHVRTWQPAMIDSETPLPAEDIFNLGSFNLQ